MSSDPEEDAVVAENPELEGVAETEHRAVPCAATGHSVWCVGFSGVEFRWPHRLRICLGLLRSGNSPAFQRWGKMPQMPRVPFRDDRTLLPSLTGLDFFPVIETQR